MLAGLTVSIRKLKIGVLAALAAGTAHGSAANRALSSIEH